VTGEAAALGSAALWALATVSLKGVTGRLSASFIMAVRTAIAAVLAVAFVLLVRPEEAHLDLPATTLVVLLTSALLPLIGDIAFVRAIAVEDLSRVFTVSTSLYILMSVAGSVLIFGEPFSWFLIAGGVAVLVGSRLVLNESNAEGEAALAEIRRRQPMLGLRLSIATAIFWSAGLLAVSEALESVEPLNATVLRLPFMAVTLGLVVGLRGDLRLKASSGQDLQTLTVSAVLVLASMLLFLLSAKLASAGTVAVLTSTSPIFAVPLAYFFLKENVTPRIVSGTAICMTGIWLTFV
jgi:drug/metabolite transporter (DMT)-like permease